MTGARPTGQRGFRDLTYLLNPDSIAVIGASDAAGNIGGSVVRFLLRFGYRGKVYPVNPRRQTVAGLRCYPVVGATPAPAALAVLAVRAPDAADLIRSSAAAGVSAGVLWAGGYAETGPEGDALQRDVARACAETGFRLIGPNSIGFINSSGPVIASFASFLNEVTGLTPGVISMVSQSGGLGTQAHGYAERAGAGFRYMVSTGNEADLTVSDFVWTFAGDDKTEVIAVYLEGLRDGTRLIAALERARAAGKPVVMLRGGATPASALAAAAHTGALATEDRVTRAVLADLGVIGVGSLEQLLDTAFFLASTGAGGRPRGNRLGIVTLGGGNGVLAADQAGRHGLTAPQLTQPTREALAPLLPPIAARGNPVDLTPQVFNDPAYLARFPAALAAITADDSIDAILVILGPMGRGTDQVISAVSALREQPDKTVCVAWPFCPEPARDQLAAAGFHVFEEPERAIRAIAGSVCRASQLVGPVAVQSAPAGWPLALPAVRPGQILPEPDCHRLLAAAGLPVAAGTLVTNEAGLTEAIGRIGLPVVLKGVSGRMTHRDVAGLVALDLRTADEARTAYRALHGRAAQLGLDLDGVYVQQLVRGKLEILVSAFRDTQLGVIVSCGSGGTLTELADDVTFARAPVDRDGAARLLGRLRLVRRPAGSGRPAPAGLDEAAAFVAAFSQVAANAPWQRFTLEVNPVVAGPAGAVAVDGLLIVEQP